VERFLELPAEFDAKSAAFMYAASKFVAELEGQLPEGSAVLLSQVNLSIAVAWPSLDDYVASLSAKRRATVRRDLARFAASGIEVRELELEDTYSFAPALRRGDPARLGTSKQPSGRPETHFPPAGRGRSPRQRAGHPRRF
jgi:hypothetical protein